MLIIISNNESDEFSTLSQALWRKVIILTLTNNVYNDILYLLDKHPGSLIMTNFLKEQDGNINRTNLIIFLESYKIKHTSNNSSLISITSNLEELKKLLLSIGVPICSGIFTEIKSLQYLPRLDFPLKIETSDRKRLFYIKKPIFFKSLNLDPNTKILIKSEYQRDTIIVGLFDKTILGITKYFSKENRYILPEIPEEHKNEIVIISEKIAESINLKGPTIIKYEYRTFNNDNYSIGVSDLDLFPSFKERSPYTSILQSKNNNYVSFLSWILFPEKIDVKM